MLVCAFGNNYKSREILIIKKSEITNKIHTLINCTVNHQGIRCLVRYFLIQTLDQISKFHKTMSNLTVATS